MKRHGSVVEFVVAQKDLDEALAIVNEQTDGKCVIGTRPQGNQVHVEVMSASLSPPEIAKLEQSLNEEAHVHNYSAGVAQKEVEF